MHKFDTIFENTFPSTIKMVKRIHYPKQIQFSESFLKSLEEEFKRQQSLEESENDTEVKPIRNYKEKFLKAVNFCVNGF
jgi:gamma-glutamylcysteine synthetase